MSEFETALKKTLEERSASATGFATADQELHQICAEAGRAVRNLTEGLATLKLVEISPGVGERAYTLDFVTEDEHRLLRVFALSRAGYPIHLFSSLESWDLAQVNSAGANKLNQLVDRTAVEKAVSALAQGDSELLPLVEFVLRNREQFGSSKGM